MKKILLLIILNLFGATVFAQVAKKVHGIIVDENNAPMIGVMVLEKGTGNGASSDLDGRYEIEVKSDEAVLQFSFLSYSTVEIPVLRKREINLQMKPESTELNDVVVVGYGSQKEASIIGAISSIDNNMIANASKVQISQSLAGNIAGIIAVQRSGELGSDYSDFWIRGISTFAGNANPLVIVDGVERNFDLIDPEEIESFSVMKDASATAIYGVRGANGVIIITTKKGEVGAPKVKVSIESAYKQPTILPEFVSAPEYMKIANMANDLSGHGHTFDGKRIQNTIDMVDPDIYPDVDWVKQLTRSGTNHGRVNVNITGGAPKIRYFVSASYHYEDGLYETDTDQNWNSNITLNKVNFRSNLDANITQTTMLNLNIGSQLTILNGPNASSDEIWKLLLEIPSYFIPMRYSDGRLSAYGAGSEKGLNPYNRLTQSGFNRTAKNTLNSTISLNQKLDFLTKGLSAKVMFAYDIWTMHNYKGAFTPELWYATSRNDDGTLNAVQVDPGKEFLNKSISSDMSYTTYLEGSVNYDRLFNDHKVTALLLYNQRVHNTNSGSGEYSVLPKKNMGVAGRVTYGFKDRYFGEFNFGLNGSENFAKGKRFGFFPSVAAGWYISEEPFFAPIKKVVSKLKLRGSYGSVGNDQIGGARFGYITEIGNGSSYDFGLPGAGNSFNGIVEGKFGSDDLTWETEVKRDLGIEIGLFNALDITVDYFYNNRRDIFMQRKTIPGSAGFNVAPWVNFGKMKNQGIDLTLDYNKTFGDWFVSAKGTFTYAKNEITEWDEPDHRFSNQYRTGHRNDQQFGLIAERLYTEEDFDSEGKLLQQHPIPNFGLDVEPGDIKYVDVNGDGQIDMKDETAIGYSDIPEIVYGLGINVAYKGFSLGARFQGAGHVTRMLNRDEFLPFARTMQKGNLYKDVIYDRWTPDNPDSDVFFPRLRDAKEGHNTVNSTWWQKDMSYLRLKELMLSYTFSQKQLKHMGLKGLRIYLLGNNLLTFSKFKLWDIELGTNTGMKYPIMRSYSIGLEMNF